MTDDNDDKHILDIQEEARQAAYDEAMKALAGKARWSFPTAHTTVSDYDFSESAPDEWSDQS